MTLKQLIHEVHRRSLWQVLAVYAAVAWFVLQIVDVLTSSYGLPPWFPGLAAALLLIGLPFVLATAFVQEGATGAAVPDPTLIPETSGPLPGTAVAARAEPGGLQRVFTWRNAILVGIGLFAIWGIVASIWMFVGFPGLVVRAEAADLFSEEDEVVIARFANQTDQAALGLAIREAIVTDLDDSDYVDVVDGAELSDVLERMQLPDTTAVTEDVAIEVARREGYPVVISGSVTRLGSGYQITSRIIEAATGEVAVRVRETAAGGGDVIETVERLSRLVRRHLGESLTSLQRSEPLPRVATPSLEALELYAQGIDLERTGRGEDAIPLLEQAVELDTAFATAYRALGMFYGNQGRLADAQRNVDRAYAHVNRLRRRERYLVAAAFHSFRGRYDSAAYYYQLEIERDPGSHVAVNNLGDIYERMGRYEDAVPLYRRMVDLRPETVTGYFNISSIMAELGNARAADSAVAVLTTRFPGSFPALFQSASAAIYSGQFGAAETEARIMAKDGRGFVSAWGYFFLSSLASLGGDIEGTLAFADSAFDGGIDSGAGVVSYLSLQDLEYAMLAFGAPERALPLVERAREAALTETTPGPGAFGLGTVAQGYALAGDLDEARDLLTRVDSIIEAGGLHPRGIAEQVRAIIALQENRVAEAIEHLRQSRANAFGMLRRQTGLLLADAYAAEGRTDEAAALYDSLTTSYRLNFTNQGMYGPVRPLAHERAASAYLSLGDTARAIHHLTWFSELWKDADPELQPRVRSALRLLDQLAGEAR